MDTAYELIAVALVSGAAAFFGSYLRKKGENLATKEDVANVVNEQTQIRAAIQRIEHDGWLRQQQWDLKRQAFWNAITVLNECRNSLIMRDAIGHTADQAARHTRLTDEVTTALTICRTVLPEEMLRRFDTACAPIRETERRDPERIEILKDIGRELQSIIRESLYPAPN